MANHFLQTAEHLRQMANTPRPPGALSDKERETMLSAAQTLSRLEKLKRDFIASSSGGEDELDQVANELMSLLGIHRGS